MSAARRTGRSALCRRRERDRGQGLVEFAMVIPAFMLLLLGMLEFGTAFNHQLTIRYATREGARIGADLVNGGGTLGCGTGQSPNAGTNGINVDQVIIEAVDRVLTSAGSPIPVSQVGQVRIYKADASGADSGLGNNWVYTSTPFALPDGTQVNFKPSGATGFPACSRSNVVGSSYAGIVDSIGVSINYTYKMVTGLGTTLSISDRTIMQLNPTNVAG